MARVQREASYATISELCETLDEIGQVGDTEEPLLFRYDGVYLDVEFISRTDDGPVIINPQEA